MNTNNQPFNQNIKRALLIGINYTLNPANLLRGCINDIKNIEKKIKSTSPNCKEILCLSDDEKNPNLKPTRQNIINSINWLIKDLKHNDYVYLHYSGHGGLTVDLSKDEISGFDSCIYPISETNIETIVDDELRSLLVDKLPFNTTCFAVFDCCHSGTGLDLKYTLTCPTINNLAVLQNTKYGDSAGSVIFLSGCEDRQTSADTVDKKNIPSGALTNALLECWDKYGSSINFASLLRDVRNYLTVNKYEQIPQMCFSNYRGIKSVLKQ
jgi:hypothetical protein